jgi:hypothetical protein
MQSLGAIKAKKLAANAKELLEGVKAPARGASMRIHRENAWRQR